MIKEWLRGKSIIIVCNLDGFDKYLIYDLIIKYNCKVICICKNIEKIRTYQNVCEEFKDKLNCECFDTSVELEWKNFYEKLITLNINVDILINVNGEDNVCSFEDLCYKDFKNSMNNNFYKIMFSVKYLLPIIKSSRTPAIITLLNLKCLSTQRGLSHYTSSTMALKGFLDTIAQEYNNIYCGVMYTFLGKKCEIEVNNSRCLLVNISYKIIKSINSKKKIAYIGNRAKLFKYVNKISPKLSKKLL